MFIRLIMYEQDDPRKCTAAKMIRDGNAKRIKHAADATLLLNPFAKEFLLPSDKKRARSITAVDCSWPSDDVFDKKRSTSTAFCRCKFHKQTKQTKSKPLDVQFFPIQVHL